MDRLYYKIISPNRKFYYQPVYFFLWTVSIVYKTVLMIRFWCYRSGVLITRKLDCRVISIGNLTLGGTGKTPMVMMIAEALKRQGRKPAILSRGYKGNSSEEVNIVCDGKRILLSSETAGDEPVMMAQRLKNIPILTGSNRFLTGQHALQNLEIDTLILDDGFQHLGLHRDTNILLLDHRNPFGNGMLFPAGDLREPIDEIQRADIICITRHTGDNKEDEIKEITKWNIPTLKTNLRLNSLLQLDTGEHFDIEKLKNQKVAAFCGIAKAHDFRHILEQFQAHLVLYRSFPDHHAYSSQDLKSIEQDAIQAKVKYILTTAKDAVKLKDISFSIPVLQVIIDLEIIEGNEVFNQSILS